MLTACSAAAPPDRQVEATTAIDNIADGGFEPGWAYVSPDRHFDPNSSAKLLDRPAFLRGAAVGYFGDGVITRQYTAGQQATMRQDRAGFVAERDLDRDGRTETYRTGYWRKGSDDGTFLAVFDRRAQRDLVDTTDVDGVFMSWAGGDLVIANCNCPQDGVVTYADGKLHVMPEGDDYPRR